MQKALHVLTTVLPGGKGSSPAQSLEAGKAAGKLPNHIKCPVRYRIGRES